MNNAKYTTNNSEKQNNSACGKSAQHWTLDHNKGCTVSTFCIPYASFEVDEDRLMNIGQHDIGYRSTWTHGIDKDLWY